MSIFSPGHVLHSHVLHKPHITNTSLYALCDPMTQSRKYTYIICSHHIYSVLQILRSDNHTIRNFFKHNQRTT